jgi:hypothetical protein
MKIGNDAVQQELVQNQWIKNNIDPKKQFDAHKEKEIFTESRQEFQKENNAPTTQQSMESPEYKMSPSMDHTNRIQPKEQVSTIKDFLQSCIKMLNDPSSIKILQNILEQCSEETQ